VVLRGAQPHHKGDINVSDYREGDTVAYQPHLGDARIVRVFARFPDIKNGLPGFEAVVYGGREDGQTVWGYDSQIIATPDRPDGGVC